MHGKFAAVAEHGIPVLELHPCLLALLGGVRNAEGYGAARGPEEQIKGIDLDAGEEVCREEETNQKNRGVNDPAERCETILEVVVRHCLDVPLCRLTNKFARDRVIRERVGEIKGRTALIC